MRPFHIIRGGERVGEGLLAEDFYHGGEWIPYAIMFDGRFGRTFSCEHAMREFFDLGDDCEVRFLPLAVAEPMRFPPELDQHYAPEHPEDKRARLDSTKEARAFIGVFLPEHTQELADLLVTYGDGRAEEKLAALREKFWMECPFGDGRVT